MSPDLTQAVLIDVLVVAGLALGLGLMVYTWVRVRTGLNWNGDGNVLSRPYGGSDAIVALVLVGLFGWMVTLGSGGPKEDVAMDTFAVGMFVGSLFFLLMAMVLVAYMGIIRGMNPAEMFGLRALTVKWALLWAVVWIVCVGLMMLVVVMVVYGFLSEGPLLDESPQEVVEMFRKMDSVLLRGMIVIAAVLIAPVAEELIFRGFLYGVTKRFTDRWFAAILTGLIFAVVHNHLGSLFPLFLLGIGFAVAYEATGSLLVPIFMHMMFNGFNVLRMLIGG